MPSTFISTVAYSTYIHALREMMGRVWTGMWLKAPRPAGMALSDDDIIIQTTVN